MLNDSELKVYLQSDVISTDTDRLILILACFDHPVQVRTIKDQAMRVGLRAASKWNISSKLSRSKGLAINTDTGWELSTNGNNHLVTLGVNTLPPPAKQVADDLRALLPDISDDITKAFVEEAIRCYEQKCHRSAIVMSWLAAVDVLKKDVVSNHLSDFNKEAALKNSKWKQAKTADDLGRMNEAEFLVRLHGINVIEKNVRQELEKCLGTRNGCGHPNSLQIGHNIVASHLEMLLLNVFNKIS